MPETSALVSEFDLRSYLDILRRRRWLIVLAAVTTVGATLTLSLLQTPLYSAEARLLFETDAVRGLEGEIEVIGGAPVRELVSDRLGAAPGVSARPARESVIAVRAESSDAERAAAIANAYVDAYLEFRRQELVEETGRTSELFQEELDDLQDEIDSIEAQIAEGSGNTAQLDERRNALLRQQASVSQTADQVQLEAALGSGGARLVTSATPPSEPFRPTTTRNGVTALLVGPIAGALLALLLEYFDDSIKSKNDLERALGGMAVLGVIPEVEGWRDRDSAVLAARADPKSAVAEAYRSLRTSLQFLGLDRDLRRIQITSSTSGEGKTTTAANLGVVMARAGQRVLVVDCDLRRPRLHQFFDCNNDVGFTSVLLGEVGISAAIHRVAGEDSFAVLPSGPIPPDPSELLGSWRTSEVFGTLASEWDVVLLDSAPVLPVTDATVLAGWVDGTLLVATSNQTSRKHLHRSAELLAQVNAPLVGAVFNGVEAEGSYQYAYAYTYGGTRDRERPRLWGRSRPVAVDTTPSESAERDRADTGG